MDDRPIRETPPGPAGDPSRFERPGAATRAPRRVSVASTRRPWPGGSVAADPIVLAALATLIASAFFLAFPPVDLWFTGLFYEPGSGFPLRSDPFLLGLREAIALLLMLAAVALLVPVAVKLARPDQPSPVSPTVPLFLLSTLALAPGLLVNGILKSFWGRPRPFMVTDFGGDLPFVPVWKITDYCARNCSFVSGEASSAIWMLAIALVVPRGWRTAVLVVTIPLALLLSFARIAFGNHFLSDVVISWGLTLLVIALLHRLLIVSPPAFLAEPALEAGLTRLGRGLRRLLRRGRSG